MLQETAQLRDNLIAAMEHNDGASLSGFTIAYGFLCDFFGTALNEEVLWVSGGGEGTGTPFLPEDVKGSK